MAHDLITKSGIRDEARLNVSSEFYDAANERLREMIAEAEDRAEENGRKTLQPEDI